MKKLKILFFFGLSLLAISCSKDDDTNISLTEASFVGTWNLTEYYTEDGKITGTYNGITMDGNFSKTGENFDYSIIVADNPKKITTKGGFSEKISMTVNPTEIIASDSENSFLMVAGSSWSFQNDVLSMGTEEFEIVRFNNNVLKLTSKAQKPNFDFSLVGITDVEVTGKQHYTLIKK